MNNLFAQYSDYNYNYESVDVSNADAATAAAAFGFVLMVTLVMTVIVYVIYAFLLSRILKKAGVEEWKAWVPLYNIWVLLELGGQPGFWAILLFVPFINIVAAVFIYIAQYHIGVKLGKPGAFVLWAIFLPIVWFVWLAFDSSKWPGKKAAPAKTAEKE